MSWFPWIRRSKEVSGDTSDGAHKAVTGLLDPNSLSARGLVDGYMGRPLADGLAVIPGLAARVDPLESAAPAPEDRSTAHLSADGLSISQSQLKGRLMRLAGVIGPQLERASRRADQLRDGHYSRRSAQLKLTLGWLSIFFLGTLLGKIVDRFIDHARGALGAPGSERIADLLTLFTENVAVIRQALLPADESRWIFALAGLFLSLVSIYAYARAGKSNPVAAVLSAAENEAVGVSAGRSWGGSGGAVAAAAEREARAELERTGGWGRLALLAGLTGLALCLATLGPGYRISSFVVGYALAAVIAGIAIVVVEARLRDPEAAIDAALARVISRTSITVISATAAVLLLSVLVTVSGASPVLAAAALAVLAVWLMCGAVLVAVGTVEEEVFAAEAMLIRQEAHVESRLRKLAAQGEVRLEELRGAREQEARRAAAGSREQAVAIERAKAAYEEAHALGCQLRGSRAAAPLPAELRGGTGTGVATHRAAAAGLAAASRLTQKSVSKTRGTAQ
jgi:uncharacterized membrane protein